MKKIFNKIAILLTASSLTLPLTACVFNFYTDSATKTVIKSFANQTSSVVKSLIMAKEKNSDTSKTIADILEKFPNSSIKNQTSDTSLNSWEEFVKYWGFNQEINIKNSSNKDSFDTKDYFRATGTGELTKQVNNYKNLNNTFDQLKLILGINVADNRTIYNLIQNNNDVKKTITNFLNETKKTNPDELPKNSKEIITLLKNIVIGSNWKNPDEKAFEKNVINPLTSLLNYLVEGWWVNNTATPPSKPVEGKYPIEKFMREWKDKDGKPYSQWNTKNKKNEDSWNLGLTYYKEWNQNNYNFYRSGTLINYLFYKIGKDYQISKPETDYKDRYLGDIITNHIKGKNVNLKELTNDLNQYVPYLLKNSSYLLLIAEAIIPIIKQWGLKINDLTKGIKNLTFGKLYPTNDTINSYNIFDILNNINYLLNNANELKTVITNLLGFQTNNKNSIAAATSFAYDIKITVFGGIGIPLPMILSLDKNALNELINTLVGLISNNTVKSAFKNILKIFQEWIKQYDDKNQGININLTKLKDFLLNDTNGLIIIINQQIIPTLYNIFTDPQPLDDAKYLEFYQVIGGQIPTKPNEEPPANFRNNSFLDIIKRNISNPNEPLGQVAYILFGNSSENIKGIFDFITESNNQWIYDNYTRLFDINNQSEGQIYNLTMTTSTKNNIISNTLSYNFVYKINNHSYYFLIKCKSSDQKNKYTGTKNFYFTDIILNVVRYK